MRLLEIIEEGSFLDQNVFKVRFDTTPGMEVMGIGGVVKFIVYDVEKAGDAFTCTLKPRLDDHRAYLELLLFRDFVSL